MLRRLSVTHHSEPTPALSFRSAPSVWDRLTPNRGRWWPFALADLIATRKARARRLMAAVHTDVVEYSRLFGLDDAGTVARLRALRQHLIAPAIRRHRGRLVQTAGDSMLITFASVADAVKCAVTIQYELARIASGRTTAGCACVSASIWATSSRTEETSMAMA